MKVVTSFNMRIDEYVKERAHAIAKKKGLTLTGFINEYLLNEIENEDITRYKEIVIKVLKRLNVSDEIIKKSLDEFEVIVVPKEDFYNAIAEDEKEDFERGKVFGYKIRCVLLEKGDKMTISL
jgi:antitoxin component of RelBE/YafQ-DinJ toxin-antitoxin module